MPITAATWTSPRTVPWFVLGDEAPVRTVAIVLHGLMQRAADLARELEPAGGDGLCVVVPEGLSRSLPYPGAAKAGASWSTGDDAEIDLRDNLRYLGDLAAELEARWPQARRILVGFSQGGLMATRWVRHAPRAWDRVVLWGAPLAGDVDAAGFKLALGEAELVLALGDSDPLAQPALVRSALDRLASVGLDWREHPYTGGHEVSASVLRELCR